MADETSKQMLRRASDRRFSTRWIAGNGIDIGCGKDPLSKLADFFPLMKSLRPWDLPDGDAMLMEGVASDNYDFVHSSHCLEHLENPVVAMTHWIRICKPGGHLIITVPDEDLYEQGCWPSTFNHDHKWTFTVHKSKSWSPRSISVLKLLERFEDDVEILKIEKLDSGFDYSRPREDQTLNALSESAIEIILKKRVKENDLQRLQNDPHGTLFAAAARKLESEQAFNEAVSLHQNGQLDLALHKYQAVLSATPDDLASLNNIALLSTPDIAEQYLSRALALKPDYLDAIINLGNLYLQNQRPNEAKAVLLTAQSIEPNNPRVLAGLLQSLVALTDLEAAKALVEGNADHFENPDDAYAQLSKLCEYENRTDEALCYANKALAINPDCSLAHAYAGRQYLKQGNYDTGTRYLVKMWGSHLGDGQFGLFVDEQGQTIRQDGRTILLSADSGLGDTIQFLRYAKLLKELGAQVSVECQEELVRLITPMEEIKEVLTKGKARGTFDLRIPLHNLMGAFRTRLETIPNAVPYLRAIPEEVHGFRQRLKDFPNLKIGLFWSGNPAHPRNGMRSIDPELLKPLLAHPGVSFFSLQKGGEGQLPNVTDWSSEFTDMATTAALVDNMDLVISVDSSVAHLAGALGRPVWLLNRFDSCWRWLEDRSDSPWYPTLTQFRQTRPGDWSEVLHNVSDELSRLIAN